jgi:glycosyltransferase involved in cell wall biosynthesis
MLGFGLGRFMPKALRRRVQRASLRLGELRSRPPLFPPTRARRAFSGRSVIVAGLFSTRSGLGRAADLIARGFESRGVPVQRVDLGMYFRLTDQASRASIPPDEASRIDASDLVLVLNPPLAYEALGMFDRAWLTERCIVAHWVWELDRLPRSWIQTADSLDEIWTASTFVEETARRALPDFPGPIRVMPYPTEVDPFEAAPPAKRQAIRGKLGIADDEFCVGYSFSAASNYERKNPEGAIEAFIQAFPNRNARAVLLLRALDLSSFRDGERRLRAMARAHRHVQILGDGSEHISIAEFYAAIDCYLAPFRAEGFGLNLVEASQAGKPVVATGWSIGAEITCHPGIHTVGYTVRPVQDRQGHYPSHLGASWAEPDYVAMAERMRDLAGQFRIDRAGQA